MRRKVVAGSVALVLVAAILLSGCARESSVAKTPGESEFREADRRILHLEGKATMGNCPLAEQLAADFGKSVTELRNQAIEKGHDHRLSLSKGQMLVFCQLTATHCAFLVHVPELRRFTGEAKQVMTAICWSSAQEVLQARRIKPDHLAVGMEGVMLYESILVGRAVGDPSADETGIEERTDRTDSLFPFFVGAPPTASAVMVAPQVKPVAAAAPAPQTAAPAPSGPPPVMVPGRPLEGVLLAEFGAPTATLPAKGGSYNWTHPELRRLQVYSGDFARHEFGDLAVLTIYNDAHEPIFVSFSAPRKLTADEIEAAKRVASAQDTRWPAAAFIEADGTKLTLLPRPLRPRR